MAAPTYFGSAAVPADGASATNATATLTITPPGSMTTGDLVVVICHSRGSTTWSVGMAGGQSWTSETAYSTTNIFCGIFWCTYNGTWSANPRFDSTDATATSAVMHVFRPDSTSKQWAVDVAQATSIYTAPSTPFTVTRAGLTTTKANTVTLACWHSVDDNTWGTISGTGWTVTGSAQYRNTAAQDHSCAFAHHLDATAGAIPNVSLNQTALGGDAGITAIIAFYSGYFKSLSDGLTLGDTREGSASFARSQSDDMSLTEYYDPAFPHTGFLLLLENAEFLLKEMLNDGRIGLEEISAGGEALTKAVADALSLGDSRTGAAGFVRTQADALALAETLARVSTWRRSLADALGLSENVTKARGLTRSYAEAITLGENFAKQMQLAKSFADAMTLGEAIARVVVLTRGLSEPLGLGENLLRNALFARLRTEAIVLGDALSKVGAFVRLLQDPITFGELVRRAFSRPLTEPISLSENVAKLFVLIRAFTDALTLGETVTRRFGKNLADPLTLAEVLARTVSFRRSLSDPLVLSELLARSTGFGRSIPESIALTEVINVLKIGPAFRAEWARRPYNIGTGAITL